MKRLVAMMAVTGAAIAAVAMPTKAALQKAQKMVSEVTAADVKALKAKTKTPAEVAAKHMELAGQAGNEAEKYVLLQGAFKLYAKAGDYEGAANALGTMNREIADMNPEVIVEIYNKAIFSSMKEKAPKLFAIKEAARRQVFYCKQLAKAEAAVKANPKDSATQKKLGECYAELGNWPKALDAFALAGGALAKTAAAEKDGTAVPQVSGDFWWDYESGDEMSTYKLHAAELYRTALADDSFKGLARTRAEQRVKEAESSGADLPRIGMFAAPTAVASVKASTLNCKMVNGRPAPLKFELAKGVDLELEGCPAGEFEMQRREFAKVDGLYPHKVKISRPFWMSKNRVTFEQFETFRKTNVWKNDKVKQMIETLGGRECPVSRISRTDFDRFCRYLGQKYSSKIPKGYVFRLPTEAEWEYAFCANSLDPSDPHMLQGKDYLEFCKTAPKDRVGWRWQDIEPALKGKGLKFSEWNVAPKVGTRMANKWGIQDLNDCGFELMLDVIDETKDNPHKHWHLCNFDNRSFRYELYEMDPVRIYDGDGAVSVTFGRHDAWGSLIRRSVDAQTGLGVACPVFRVCLGPDLIAEKKAKGNSDADAKKTEVAGSDACYPREDFGGVLLSSKYEIVEYTGKMRYVRHKDGLFNCERPNRSAGDGFAFEVGAKEKEAGFTLALPEPVTLAGLLVVNRAETCQERQVPLCVWVSEDRVKWERVFIDESVRDEYRIGLSNKNITCKYLRFGRLPGVNSEPFHLARTLVYAKPSAAGKKAKK